MKRYIKNFDELAITKERADMLEIMNSAYGEIDTTKIIDKSITLEGSILTIRDTQFDLENFDNIYLFGFGKDSSIAVKTIEKILGNKITGGIVMDKRVGDCTYVKQYICTHPRPSKDNIPPSEKLAQLAKKLGEKDFAIVIVSGGGSSMVCWPESEYDQGVILYNEFLKTGGNITELNTLRKHLSLLKGGGLAKLLHPATVASLIFCDVPGNKFEEVASGPTYKDTSSIEDALSILSKYDLPFNLDLNETPKEDMYFEKVHNIPMVTNDHALMGMEKKAKELGYKVINIGSDLYQNCDTIIENLIRESEPCSVVIGAGEPSIAVTGPRSIGGRCQYFTLKALSYIKSDHVISSFASDGIDNLSISAGAIADKITKDKILKYNLSISETFQENTIDEFFTQTKDQIITGETGSNVSDLMILLNP